MTEDRKREKTSLSPLAHPCLSPQSTLKHLAYLDFITEHKKLPGQWFCFLLEPWLRKVKRCPCLSDVQHCLPCPPPPGSFKSPQQAPFHQLGAPGAEAQWVAYDLRSQGTLVTLLWGMCP